MNLASHIDRALEHYSKAIGRIEVWQMEKAAALRQHKANALKLNEKAALDEKANLEREYKNKLEEIVSELDGAMSEVDAAFDRDLRSFYEPDGTAIHAADQALLSSGILTAAEVSEMVVRHAENTTMLRIIKRFAEADGMILSVDAERAVSLAASNGEAEQREYANFRQRIGAPVNMALQGLAGTEAFANCALRATEYAQEAKSALTAVNPYSSGSEK